MIIRDSLQVLEQISKLEEKISAFEKLMGGLGIQIDKEQFIKIIMTRREESSGHELNN